MFALRTVSETLSHAYMLLLFYWHSIGTQCQTNSINAEKANDDDWVKKCLEY